MKHTSRLLIFALLLNVATATAQEVRNVILMIGDGMGLAHTGALMIESGYQPLSFDRAQYIGLSKTYSANNRVTDSAAAGTAMATGHKTNNGMIAMTPDSLAVPTLTELAKAKGLSTGLVITSHMTDATPSAFAAHAANRHDSERISACYATAGLDIIAGGGRQFFRKSLDGRDIIHELQAKGYRYTESPEAFCDVDELPLLGLFADHDMPRADVRGEEYLAQATEHTLDLLSRNANGFFVMIEGSQIDDASHDNNFSQVIAEMRDFDHAVNEAFDFADEHPGTLVIVVADHETGGLTMISNKRDFTAAESGINYKFSTGSHSGIPVVLYAYGTGASHFAGVMENTDIFLRIKRLLIDTE